MLTGVPRCAAVQDCFRFNSATMPALAGKVADEDPSATPLTGPMLIRPDVLLPMKTAPAVPDAPSVRAPEASVASVSVTQAFEPLFETMPAAPETKQPPVAVLSTPPGAVIVVPSTL